MAAEALPQPATVAPSADADARFRLRVAWTLAGVWLLLGAYMLVRRPEALLEHAALGAAGLLAVTALDWRGARRLDVLLAAAVALGVAASTWPLRRYAYVAELQPILLTAMVLPPSLAVLWAIGVRPRARERTPGRLLGGGRGLLGGRRPGLAALVSVDPGGAAFTAWTGYAVPAALGLLVGDLRALDAGGVAARGLRGARGCCPCWWSRSPPG